MLNVFFGAGHPGGPGGHWDAGRQRPEPYAERQADRHRRRGRQHQNQGWTMSELTYFRDIFFCQICLSVCMYALGSELCDLDPGTKYLILRCTIICLLFV